MKPSYLRMRVLAVFVRTQGELCGADITRLTHVGTGSVYPALAALEGAGLLRSRWETMSPEELGRPQKRLYAITAKGFREYAQMAMAVRLT